MDYKFQLIRLLSAIQIILFICILSYSNARAVYDEEGWTNWSEWSECSRSCDGGVTKRSRYCNLAYCNGNDVEYQICNMQECPSAADFRDQQCYGYGNVSYHHPTEPCVLFCVTHTGEVSKIASKVRDGTRCRPGSLEICIDGICQPVGCDFEIGSTKVTDQCGVCGGDGLNCTRQTYEWNENTNTTCSAKCGGGYKQTEPFCQNIETGDIVSEEYCDPSTMPSRRALPCHMEPCPPRWETTEWSVCSRSCDSGTRTRHVYCVEEQNNTTKKVWTVMCKGKRPHRQEACSIQPCPPEWITGPWSECSCENGTQVRDVTCKNEVGMNICDPDSRPASQRTCSTTPCPGTDAPRLSAIRHELKFQPEKLIGKDRVSPHTRFVTEEWSSCSTSCGNGIRRRKVYCKALLDYGKIMKTFADENCAGEKPSETELCTNKPCTNDTIWGPVQDRPDSSHNMKIAPAQDGKTYSWVTDGYTACTATCLGGVQELIVNCIRDEDRKVVSPYLCPIETQPQVFTRTCNDLPCPPRWNVSDYQQCTKKCGMGIQTREVHCIHEVTLSNTVLVPAHLCSKPPPADRQYCNVIDCPVEWYTSNWSKCSETCGVGMSRREVECRQVTAQNHVISLPDHMCPTPKPGDTTPCSIKSCESFGKNPVIFSEDKTYNQQASEVEVSLKIGGEAYIFTGTRLRLRCPVKKFNRADIKWIKDGKVISNNKNYHVSKKGILKISKASPMDNGVYTCSAGQASGHIKIHIKPKLSEFPPSSEEFGKQDIQQAGIPLEYVKSHGFGESDISHERITEESRSQRQKYLKQQKTLTSPKPNWLLTTTKQPEDKNEVVGPLLPSSTSSSSRLLPYFHSFFTNIKDLWPLQRNRGYRTVKQRSYSFTDPVTKNEAIKGDQKNAKLEWLISPWSNCSPACGGTGFQQRSAHCMAKINNVTQNVEENLCRDAGMPRPSTIQKCNTDDCPFWVSSDWLECNESRCFTWNTAMQKRDVVCEAPNSTVIADHYCDEKEKPASKQECYNDLCKGTWRVGEWSECTGQCEKEGMKYRILQCVWYGTKRPAGTACRDQQRPPVMRVCRGPPCLQSKECRDKSQYCKNVKMLNMCRIARYQVQCCQTCRQ